jgi:preprotein translocase subunit SecY
MSLLPWPHGDAVSRRRFGLTSVSPCPRDGDTPGRVRSTQTAGTSEWGARLVKIDPRTQNRIYITLAILAAVRLGDHIPLPGLNPPNLGPLDDTAWPSPLPGGGFFTQSLPRSYASIFATGILPYIHASIIILLLSGMIPALRRLREEGSPLLERAIVSLALVIGAIRALSLIRDRDAFLLATGNPLVERPMSFLVVIGVCTGTALLIWAARAITRYGIGNGVVWIFLTEKLGYLIPALGYELPGAFDRWDGGVVSFVLLFAALSGITVLLLRTGKKILLIDRKFEAGPESPEEESLTVILRANSAGVLPILALSVILGFPVVSRAFLSTVFHQGYTTWFVAFTAFRLVMIVALF